METQLWKRMTFCSLAMAGGLLLILIGGSLNQFVIEKNQNFMPTLTKISLDGIYGGSDGHFYYNNFNQVNYWFLTDIFEINNVVYSLGDFVIIFGAIVFTISAFIFLHWNNRLYNLNKSSKKERIKKNEMLK